MRHSYQCTRRYSTRRPSSYSPPWEPQVILRWSGFHSVINPTWRQMACEAAERPSVKQPSTYVHSVFLPSSPFAECLRVAQWQLLCLQLERCVQLSCWTACQSKWLIDPPSYEWTALNLVRPSVTVRCRNVSFMRLMAFSRTQRWILPAVWTFVFCFRGKIVWGSRPDRVGLSQWNRWVNEWLNYFVN
jgi:hypothetical protein